MKTTHRTLALSVALAGIGFAVPPAEARFLQSDPIGYKDQINLYVYVGNDPLNRADPTGQEAALIWTSPTTVQLIITYQIVNSSQSHNFNSAQVNATVAQMMSGTVTIGNSNVTVTATAREVRGPMVSNSAVTKIWIDPKMPSRPAGNPQRPQDAYTNQIGGSFVRATPQDDAGVVTHELGHAGGAGDQYTGGVDAKGQPIPAGVFPNTNTNLMDSRGTKPANSQTLTEILTAPTNRNACMANVTAPTGAC